MMGLITSLFGGRPGMISGATGAMAVVMVHLIQQGNSVGEGMGMEMLGLSWLFITLLFVGAIQIVAGLFRLGKFVRLIPHPVMMGFVNGLAIVIFLSQLGMFTHNVNGQKVWIEGTELYTMMGLVGLTMAIMWLLPKVTKVVPAALTGIIVVAAIAIGFNMDVSTVGSFIREGGGEGLKGGLPQFRTRRISPGPKWAISSRCSAREPTAPVLRRVHSWVRVRQPKSWSDCTSRFGTASAQMTQFCAFRSVDNRMFTFPLH